ncbi:MAG: hypothetical protein QGF79_04675 [Arenicellales bacterium]|nr:hypothetical protein [Arenicellales bacterium]MDP6552119.1 hypothetical protein [Arenicellales bacterium]
MQQRTIDRITGTIAVALLVWFIVGLAAGSSSDFAGFWGGPPFWVISVFVLAIVIYDLWAAAFRRKT